MTLLEIFQKYGTDKADLGYAPAYEMLFDHRRERVLNLLEVGIGTLKPGAPSSMDGIKAGYQTGASLRAWRDYFPYARIFGLDIQDDTMFVEPRITTMLGDSTSPLIHQHLSERWYDVIIDDGSHVPLTQIATLQNCWALLRRGGTYIIEDVIGDQLYDTQDNWRQVVGVTPVFIRCSTTMLAVLIKH